MTNLSERIGQTYDELPYRSHAFRLSAPEHLAAVARLFGLQAPPIENARVLELGCAAGGNLVPFAARHPQADVVGLDLSVAQVEAGRRAVEAMGLKNLRLIQGSIADLDASLGRFDYILCHGVYSWVPDHVRGAILRTCETMLTPQGVAYISYNTYPGWKTKEVVRDAMLLRAGDRVTPQERLAYARGMIEFLHEMAPADSLLAKVIGNDIEMVRSGEDYYLAHEYLELCNAPCYFRDFVAAARSHSLEYLGDASVGAMFASNYGRAAEPLLSECGGDQVVLEQLIDFLSNRTFRQSLLVRAEQAAGIRYRLEADNISCLHVGGWYTEVPGEEGSWRYFSGTKVGIVTELQRNVLARLNEAWPGTVPAHTLLDAAPAEDRARVLGFLNTLVVGNAVSFRREPIARPVCTDGRATVRPAVRAIAADTASPVSLFNEWHTTIDAPPLERFLIARLDGQHDAGQLAEAVIAAIGQGTLSLSREGDPVRDAADIAATVRALTAQALTWIQTNGLLVSSESTPKARPGKAAQAKPKSAPANPAKSKPAADAKAPRSPAKTKPAGRK